MSLASQMNKELKEITGFNRAFVSLEIALDVAEGFPSQAFAFLEQKGLLQKSSDRILVGQNTWLLQAAISKENSVPEEKLFFQFTEGTSMSQPYPELPDDPKGEIFQAVYAIQKWQNAFLHGENFQKFVVGEQISLLLNSSESAEIEYTPWGSLVIVYGIKNLLGSRRWKWAQNASKLITMLKKEKAFLGYKISNI